MSVLHVAHVGPSSSGQAKRGLLTGVKFKVLTFEENGHHFYLYAGMSRLRAVTQLKNDLINNRDTLVELFKELVARRPQLVYYKSYIHNWSVSRGHSIIVHEGDADTKITKKTSRVSTLNAYEKKLAEVLHDTFGNMDFTLRADSRDSWLDTDITTMQPAKSTAVTQGLKKKLKALYDSRESIDNTSTTPAGDDNADADDSAL